ncbi:MAG: DUF4115 domain-containing protein [Gammaproteobacteria bacterium]|jgi:cytoskeleton protein RodZ|nr:DUF4115 domain-containing protein [Gammaproteobacteria bacterium]
MSELESVVDEAAKQGELPGVLLRQARENLEWSVADLAGKLHLTESAVISLEADRYDDLPGVTFVRGYIRSYAKLVGLDPDALARLYTQTTIIEPVRALPDLGRTVARNRSRGRLLMALLLIIVLAGAGAGYYWWQEGQMRNVASQEAGEIAFSQVEIERADGTLFIQSLDQLDAYTADLDVAEISLDSLPQALEDDADAGASDEPQADEGKSQPTAEANNEAGGVADEQIENQQTVADAGMHQLQLTFTDECWIRITDGSGNEVASGLHKAGEVLELSGTTPFELHIGNASGVQLRFNGQPVDIHSSIRGNVARIKLG